MARLLSEGESAALPLPIACGAAFHPSPLPREAVAAVSRPMLLCPAGDDKPAMQPGGEVASGGRGAIGYRSEGCAR